MRALPDMIDFFKQSGKIGCFIAVRAPFNFHLAEFDGEWDWFVALGRIKNRKSGLTEDTLFFAKRSSTTFERAEELVLEPFNRLIKEQQLVAYKYEGFWRAMDTLRDRQILEEMVEQGEIPWRPGKTSSLSG